MNPHPLTQALRRHARLAVFLLAGCVGPGPGPAAPPPTDVRKPPLVHAVATPPVAAQRPASVTLHGDTRIDEFAWLGEKENPEVLAYLEAENAYTETMMEETSDLQATLFEEIVGRIRETDTSVPAREGGYWYYTRTEEGKDYPIRCRREGGLDADEEVILDLNDLAAEYDYVDVVAMEISPDGRHAATILDTIGGGSGTLHVLDLGAHEAGPEAIEGVTSTAWAADNRTLYYVVEDAAARPYRLYRHRLGEETDTFLHEEADERFSIDVSLSRSRAYLLLDAYSHTTSEVRFLRADDPEGEFRLLAGRVQGAEYYVSHRGDRFYILTNDAGRNFRVVTVPVATPDRTHWEDFLPHDAEVMRTGFEVFARHWVASEREGGLPQLRIGDFETGASHRIALPESVFEVNGQDNFEFDTTTYRYAYESLVTPPSVYDYDMDARTRVLLKQEEVIGGYDPGAYAVERLHAAAADGTRIPISLCYRKGARSGGPAPTVLHGYGAYGDAFDVYFSRARLSLLDRGVIYAIAHIRGGGEMGKAWHDGGRMRAKTNTFTDFIAVAEHLVTEGYTAPDRLAIEGGSAGGLLMGAVLNLRPDLFRAALLDVPFVDVLNTMLDETLPLTVGEFEEWGNPKDPEDYAAMRRYCPYTNIAAVAYPAMLVRASIDDAQVMYWEASKYVARMRARRTDDRPLLLKVQMAGGHGGPSGRHARLREIAFDYAFELWQIGVTEGAAPTGEKEGP